MPCSQTVGDLPLQICDVYDLKGQWHAWISCATKRRVGDMGDMQSTPVAMGHIEYLRITNGFYRLEGRSVFCIAKVGQHVRLGTKDALTLM